MKSMPAQSLCEMETMIPDELIAALNKTAGQEVHGHKHNLKNRFELKKTLGEGTYGKVKLALERTTGEQFAIKYIRKSKIHDEHDLNRIRREIKIMSSVRHPHIVNVREVFENKDKIILVMECADGGELYDYINNKQLTEKDARRVFRQIVSAIKHCHQNGIVHRDLKLENILLDRDYNAKIADFGLSNFYSPTELLKTYCGSPLYASPEIVNGLPYYGPEVDCWSLGVVLYTLVYGTMPFDGTNFKKLRTQITTGDYYEPDKPSEAAGLIRHLLTVNPAKRATISDILSHWWVNLGHSFMPDNEPYIPPMVLQPVPSYHNQTLSSSSESDDGEPQCSGKTKTVKPLKGILKKPKMTENVSEKKCNDSLMPNIERTVNENVILADSQPSDEAVFNESPDNQTGSQISNLSESVSQSNQISNDIEDDASVVADETSGKKVFDSRMMPKRSILKRKGKFSAGDSGCELNDLNRKDSVCLSVRPMDLSEADSALDSPDNVLPHDNISMDKTRSSCDNLQLGAFSFGMTETLTSKDSQNLATAESVPLSVIPRRRGILKNANRDSDKRLSACSTGSNSSADILDFSYDSFDEILKSRFCSDTSPKTSPDYGSDVRDLRLQGQAALQDDLFNYQEAKEVYQKALDICKDM
ncbi:NUAK family SNF1-like kinase 1 [Mercenaria mercenaria]|uniref:NUAK family SNF1-like kinase 1 n=1 Tax=Mercenaria mercenaria TaxID=6596 RepID=UPI00234ED1CC|nr:NUAK family SNF1-like kinase 1 [Mercenaria mercenaria]